MSGMKFLSDSRLVLAALLISAGQCALAAAVDNPIGIWTLSMPGTPRQCRLQLRADPAATGQTISMPPGCRRAFPALAAVRSWSVPDGIHLALNDEVGANVLMFDEAADGRLQAAGPESEAAYILTPLTSRRAPTAAPLPTSDAAPTVRSGADAPPVVATAAPPAIRPAVTVASMAGHYAVMRGSRDTGCMVTLEQAGTSQANLRARLAPACRDQGIIVFDPIGWALKGSHLVLAARRGHTATFSEDDAGVWVKDAKTGQPMGLKRL